MYDFSKNFGCKVFSYEKMKKFLPEKLVKNFKEKVSSDSEIEQNLIESIANAMKQWAILNGATHFVHWFHPMTNSTAEKHDSFLEVLPEGRAISNFSAKNLIKGEPDASSFPSGGLRSTANARGYTFWDPTTFAFIKNNSLYIPTLFYSYNGEVLDEKTPLLRSMKAVNKWALKVLKLINNTSANKIYPVVGAEQEYFLIDKKDFNKRTDLKFCEETLFGKLSIKNKKALNHYFSNIKPRISKFMKEVDEELWALGIPSKTKHNEVAPCQFEIAQIYVPSNIALDHNQLIMQILKDTADHYDLACLLHEKPFSRINGSGKHNNWSLVTDTGINLFEPGNFPEKNIIFLTFLCAVIAAVDKFSDILRISVASAGNDKRLGGNEAPPAIVSIYLGEKALKILESIENEKIYTENKKDHSKNNFNNSTFFHKDYSDRNRTSPFAFNTNKFEFRMVGSNQSIGWCNTILNTIVADSLENFANQLEKSENPKEEIYNLLKKTIKNHKKIIFNGNNYSPKWLQEAQNRNLPNFKTFSEAIVHLIDEKNIHLFEKHKIFTKEEIFSKYKIKLENYCNIIECEANTMAKMLLKEILPSASTYTKVLSKTIKNLKKLNFEIENTYEFKTLTKLIKLSSLITKKVENLENSLSKISEFKNEGLKDKTEYLSKFVIKDMYDLRKITDELENLIPKNIQPFPDYEEILIKN